MESTTRAAVERILERIAHERGFGVVSASTSSERTIVAASAAADLLGVPQTEIGMAAARVLIVDILGADLASRAGTAAGENAHELVGRLMSLLGPTTSFYTNTQTGAWWPLPRVHVPMTDATFDTGVVAIASWGSACFWVADED